MLTDKRSTTARTRFVFHSCHYFSAKVVLFCDICKNSTHFFMCRYYEYGGRAYPVRHYPIAIRLRDRKGRAILCIALNPQSGDFSGAILGVRSVALLHGKIRQGIREGEETAILIKVLFCNLEFFGSSLVHPWFILGLLHGVDIQGTREQNLNKKHFCQYSFIWRSCLPCTALPCSHTAAYPQGVRHSMYCA